MGAVVSWILSILAIVIVATVVDIFLAEKKLGKTVRSVLSSLVVLIVITPLPIIFSNTANCNDFFKSDTLKLDENFLDYANRQKVSALEEGVENAFNQKGYKNVKVHITAQISTKIEITRVEVDLTKLSVDNPTLGTNKEEKVAVLCAEFLGVNKSIILVYT